MHQFVTPAQAGVQRCKNGHPMNSPPESSNRGCDEEKTGAVIQSDWIGL